MDLKLTGKTALVTGTGSQAGFGKGIAEMLALPDLIRWFVGVGLIVIGVLELMRKRS